MSHLARHVGNRTAYDYLVVGAGLFGATFARVVTDTGRRCLVIDRRDHIAGNCYSEHRDGIDVHVYGPHIFHTNSRRVWRFVNRFGAFRDFRLRVVARHDGQLYSLPFSLQTLYEFYGDGTPAELLQRLESDRLRFDPPRNLREQALSLIGTRIYKALVEGYSSKQWGRDPTELPASIIRRIAVRSTFCVDYFDDVYQGIPVHGYTAMVEKMLDGIEVKLGVDFLDDKRSLVNLARRIVYTGPLDALYNYCFGGLAWRFIDFDHRRVDCPNFQGTAVVNYCDLDVPWTRITEHRHFNPTLTEKPVTWITKEFSRSAGTEPAYPIEDAANRGLWARYRRRAVADGYLLGGRLAEYRYYDMHQVIASALACASREVGASVAKVTAASRKTASNGQLVER